MNFKAHNAKESSYFYPLIRDQSFLSLIISLLFIICSLIGLYRKHMRLNSKHQLYLKIVAIVN